MDKLFTLKTTQPTNRTLYSLTALKPSQKLLECQPLVSATLKSQKSEICNWCLMKRQCFRCSSCKSFYYCTKQCQKNDWSIHKLQCKIYQNMVNVKNLSVLKEITTEFVLNLRISLKMKHQSEFQSVFCKMISLQEHQTPQKMQQFQELAVVLLENLGEQKSAENVMKMMKQLNIVAVNAFTVQDFLCETDGVAIGLYSPANYINHDCQPNCTQYFDGRYLNIVANKAIPTNQELSICYTNPLSLSKERKAFLRQHYLFECFCQLCQVQGMLNTQFRYVVCPDCQGQLVKGGSQNVNYQCQSCKKTMDMKQMENRISEIEKMIKNFQKLQDPQHIKKYFFVLKRALHLSHPFFAEAIDKVYHATINSLANVSQEKQKKLLQEAYILQKEQIKGIPIWYRLEQGQQKNIRFFIKYAQFGKLCYNLGKFQKAFNYTQMAYELIKSCHLKNKYVEVYELEKRFQEIQIELSMAKSNTFKNA